VRVVGKVKAAGTCPDCGGISQEWFEREVCPFCEEAAAQLDQREEDEPSYYRGAGLAENIIAGGFR